MVTTAAYQPLGRLKQSERKPGPTSVPWAVGAWAGAWRKWGGHRRDNSGVGLVMMSQPLLALAQHGTCGLDSKHSLSQPDVAYEQWLMPLF